MLTRADLSPDTLVRVLEQSTDCVKLISLDKTVLWMNANGLCAMEIAQLSDIEGKPWARLWPEDERHHIEQACHSAANGQVSQFEAFCPTAKGSPRWWEVRTTQVFGQNGNPVGFVAISRDVTEARQNRHALDLTLKEMHHRLGNAYAIAGGLIAAFADGSPELDQFAREMQKRLHGLHKAQSMFVGNAGACNVAELVQTLTKPIGGQSEVLTVGELPNGTIDRGRADAIALVLSELSVNSLKHGAFRSPGKVVVRGDTADGTIRLFWTETLNIPIARRSRPGGQGLLLIEQIVASRGGTLWVEWQERQLQVAVEFPADH